MQGSELEESGIGHLGTSQGRRDSAAGREGRLPGSKSAPGETACCGWLVGQARRGKGC